MNRLWLAGMGMAAIMLTGCAAEAPRQDAGQASAAVKVQQDREQQCRAAIEEVERYCSGDGFSQTRCDRAKARSTELCI